MANDGIEPGCSFCEVTAALPEVPVRERVYVGPGWRVRAHRSALPGWTLVIPRRHITSLGELTDDEAVELGLLLRDLTSVYVQELGALKSYVQQFAEGTPHAHFSVTPRMPDLPSDRLGAKASAYNSVDEPISEEERDRIAERLAAAWPRGPHTAEVTFAAGAEVP
jgi:diadenosine tetraphosphate (Ap4A) HIT family hydrolase